MKNLDNYSVLILPGREGAGPDHWLTHWERVFPAFVRVEQVNWMRPVYIDWAAKLSEYVANASKPVLLVCHSLGTSMTMRWAFDRPELASRVAGAFLAAPSDRDVMEGKPDNPVKGFGPMLLKKLPFPSIVIGSESDPFVSVARAEVFAKSWGSSIVFVDVGANSHFSSTEKLGIWPLGLITLGQFLESI